MERKSHLSIEIFVIIALIFVLQIFKFFASERADIFLNLFLSFMLGLFLVSLTTLLFGDFKRKHILEFLIMLVFIVLVAVTRYDLIFTFFIMAGVLFTLISISENLVKDLLKKN